MTYVIECQKVNKETFFEVFEKFTTFELVDKFGQFLTI